jgi:hypothetical protein
MGSEAFPPYTSITIKQEMPTIAIKPDGKNFLVFAKRTRKTPTRSRAIAIVDALPIYREIPTSRPLI